MTDLTARLSSHDDPRLYREADELMHEAAAEISRLRAELASARAAAPSEPTYERAAFEAWALPILGDNPTWRESGSCELAWQAWQAACVGGMP